MGQLIHRHARGILDGILSFCTKNNLTPSIEDSIFSITFPDGTRFEQEGGQEFETIKQQCIKKLVDLDIKPQD
jgi:hypothetical protein